MARKTKADVGARKSASKTLKVCHVFDVKAATMTSVTDVMLINRHRRVATKAID